MCWGITKSLKEFVLNFVIVENLIRIATYVGYAVVRNQYSAKWELFYKMYMYSINLYNFFATDLEKPS